MKNKLMGALLATSMIIAAPVFADGDVSGATPASTDGWGISAAFSTLLTPSEWHKGKAAWVSGTAALAIVAIVAYKMGAADAEENTTKDGDLI